MADIVDVFWAIVYLPIHLVMLAFYPVIALINTLLWILNQIYIPIALFMNNCLSMVAIVLELIKNLMSVFPTTVTLIIAATITITVALRLYAFISDISILGVKI